MTLIRIVSAADDNYAQHLGVMLCSLGENNPKNDLEITVLDAGISRSSRSKMHSVGRNYKMKILFQALAGDIYKDFKITGHASKATYYRLSISEVLDQSINKVLYLDSDLVVLGDLLPLWEHDIDNFSLGAVQCTWFTRFQELGIPYQKYFNAGVLLINLKRWRQDHIGEKTRKYIFENPQKIECWDQDALNVFLFNQWRPLEPRWNMSTDFLDKKSYTATSFSEESFNEALNHPVIVHFTGHPKPWHDNYEIPHPYKGLYQKYLAQTPWRGYELTDRALKNKLKSFMQNMAKIISIRDGIKKRQTNQCAHG